MKSSAQHLIKIPAASECKILERLNKFIVKIEIDETEDLAFLQNTGRLQQYIERGRMGFCIPIKKPKRLRYRLFAVRDNSLCAVLDTLLQAKSFESALKKNFIPWLIGYQITKRDVRINHVRADYLVERKSDKCFLELKSAILRLDGCASYPDCPSTRAFRQLKAMLKLVKSGATVFLIFVAAVPNVIGFKLNHHADPRLCSLIKKAAEEGVNIKGISIGYDPDSSSIALLDYDLPIEI